MQVINYQNKPVIVFTPLPDRIEDTKTFAQPVPNKPHLFATAYNEQVFSAMQAMGMNPPPLMKKYKWPGPHKPWRHQQVTAEALARHRRMWLLNEMRTGKTYSMLWAEDRLRQMGTVRRSLYLVPKSVIQTTWERELFHVRPDAKVFIGHGSVDDLAEACTSGKYDTIIANHDKVRFCPHEMDQFGADLINVDEWGKFKNHRTDRYKNFRWLVRRPKTRMWLATGSPNPKAPTDIWSGCKLVDPTRVPARYGVWRDMTMFPVSRGMYVKYKKRAGWKDEVAKVLHPSICYYQKDCIDMPLILPPEIRRIPLVAAQKKALKAMQREHSAIIQSGVRITAVNAAAALSKYYQIAGGVVYDEFKSPHILHDVVRQRVEEIVDLWHKSGQKIIVVCSFTSMQEAYATEWERQTKTKALVLNGKSSTKRRTEINDLFAADPDYQAIIGHEEPMQFGFNFSSANYTVWVTPTNKPEGWVQCNQRMVAAKSATKRAIGVVALSGSPAEDSAYQHLIDSSDDQKDSLAATDLYRSLFT